MAVADSPAVGKDFTEWKAWLVTQSLSLTDQNSTDGDPLFTDAANADFTLQSTSPAIDAGLDVSLVLDYIGATVPFNTLPDIGAYEYSIAAPSTDYEVRFPRFKDFTKFPRR